MPVLADRAAQSSGSCRHPGLCHCHIWLSLPAVTWRGRATTPLPPSPGARSQPAPASSDWAGEQPEAQAQGAGTASQAVHTGQGDEGGAALSQAPAPGCRRGLSSDGPPKLNSICARPGLTARRVCVLRLCRTFTPRPPRGGGGRHRLLRSLTALGVSPFLTGSHPENTLRGGRARQACLRPVSAYERLLLRGGESSGKQASRGLKCWVLSFNTRLKRLEYVLLLFQPGCTG